MVVDGEKGGEKEADSNGLFSTCVGDVESFATSKCRFLFGDVTIGGMAKGDDEIGMKLFLGGVECQNFSPSSQILELLLFRSGLGEENDVVVVEVSLFLLESVSSV